MTIDEFDRLVKYVAAATGKTLIAESRLVYFDLLGDLDFEAAMIGVKKAVLEHRYPTFPNVAELREACTLVTRGQVAELSAAEAWGIAWKVVRDTDPEVDGSFRRACDKAKAPPEVVNAIETFGLLSLCFGAEPIGVLRGQFMRTFAELAEGRKRRNVLPPKLTEAIEARKQLGSPIAKALEGVGIPAGGAK